MEIQSPSLILRYSNFSEQSSGFAYVNFLQADASRPLTQMVDAMLGSKKTIDEKMADAQFKMFTDSASA
jgi:hypothetical protein